MSHESSQIIVATSRGLWVAGNESPVAFEGRHVRGLAVGDGTVFVVVARHEVWRAAIDGDPAGWTWSRVARSDRQLTSLHPARGTLWAGTDGAHLLRTSTHDDEGFEPVEAFDRHAGRESWYTPWGGPPAVRSIASAADDTLYANVHVGGILRSRDGGRSWAQTIDIGIDVHQVVVAEEAGLVLAPSGRGFAESRDGGDSWRETTAGLDFSYMRAAAVAGETLLVSASNGPHGDRGAVYRRPLESTAPFERCADGLPEWFEGNVDTFCLASAAGVSAVGSPGGAVFVSSDAGMSWRAAVGDLPGINGLLVTAGGAT